MRDTFNSGAVNLSRILGNIGDYYTLEDLGYTEDEYDSLTQEIRSICNKIYNFRAFGAPWMFSNTKIMFNGASMTEKVWVLRKSIIYLVADEWGQVNLHVLDHIYKHPMEIFFNIAPNGVIRDFYDIKGSKEPKMFKLHGSSVLEYYYLSVKNAFSDNTSSSLDVTLFSMPIKDHIQCAAHVNQQGLLTASYNPEQGYLNCFNIYTRFAKAGYSEGITDSDAKNMGKPPLSAQSIAAIMAEIYVNKNRVCEYTEHERKDLISKLESSYNKTIVMEKRVYDCID